VIQVPGYSIKREIGVGGMATVYLAVQTSLEREVALKVMTPALVTDPNFSRRFLMEARTLASLSHPNIVAVYDVGVTDQQLHYFSMQHLPGGDFTHRITAGPPDPAEVARVLGGVARALGFAHLRGFVHRDVSPANILFDATDNPVLTDFGIARAVTRTSRLTNAGASVGTSHYMSPEQARGGNVDARSDLYSLGAVAYEALTGQPPFDGEDGFAIAYAHVFEPVPRLPAALASWQALLDRALAKDPAERFVDAEQFLAALEQIASAAGFSLGLPPSRTTGVHEAMPRLDPPPTVAIPAPQPATNHAPTLAVPAPVAAPAARSRVPLAAVAAIVLGLAGLGTAAWVNLSGERQPELVATAQPAPSRPPTATPALPSPSPAPSAPAAAPSTVESTLPAGADALPIEEAQPDPEAEQRAIATGVVDPVNLLLALGRADVAAQRLGNPPGRNAIERYRMAIRLAEHFRAPAEAARGRQGLVDTAEAYFALAGKSFEAGKLGEFLDFARRARELAAPLAEGAELDRRIGARLDALRDDALAAGRKAVLAWDRAAAKTAFERALQIDPRSQDAERGLRTAARIGAVGYVFRDPMGTTAEGPELVVVQAGGKRIAAARAEASLAEFRAFWSEGGSTARAQRPSCRDRESFFSAKRARTFEAPGFQQTPRHPVVCVTYADAEAFAEWLSRRTGKRYRLPTSAEWTTLAAATPAPADCRSNLADASYRGRFRDDDALSCDDGHAESAPVRSFDAPAGAVYDIAGNVREWVSDCAPGCREHTVMGSAWNSTADRADTTQRETYGVDVASNTIGFRVVRDIE
jgi:serine/threonine-protein kinase PpkA